MKRIVIIALLVIPFTLVSKAQVKFGLKLGLTSTSIDLNVNDLLIENNADIDELAAKGANSKVGIQGGLMARIEILKLYVQPELLLTSTGGEVEITEYLSAGSTVSTIKDQQFNKLDIPIMVGYKIGPLRLQVGPIASIVLSSKSALKDYDIEEEFNGATWGYQAGLGLDIGKKLTIDVKYEGSLSKLANGVNIGNQSFDFDSRSSQTVFSLGYFF